MMCLDLFVVVWGVSCAIGVVLGGARVARVCRVCRVFRVLPLIAVSGGGEAKLSSTGLPSLPREVLPDAQTNQWHVAELVDEEDEDQRFQNQSACFARKTKPNAKSNAT